jgi:hypothetical protein
MAVTDVRSDCRGNIFLCPGPFRFMVTTCNRKIHFDGVHSLYLPMVRWSRRKDRTVKAFGRSHANLLSTCTVLAEKKVCRVLLSSGKFGMGFVAQTQGCNGNVMIILNKRSCPSCGAPDIRRSPRKTVFERAASIMILPWRCDTCYARFFQLRWTRIPSGATESPVESHAKRTAAGGE